MRNLVQIALLRGVNVGGKNKLPMADLRQAFLAAGCRQVRTYIQSGNVVFRASRNRADRISQAVARSLAERFGVKVPVIQRSIAELEAARDSNPFLAAGCDNAKLHVVFLADAPDSSGVARLDPDRSPPDEFALHGREIFLFCPNGMARTRYTNAYWDSSLKTTSTVRNWKTVLKLIELAEEL
jgi:uncharacterized protein (DUF1697 family)